MTAEEKVAFQVLLDTLQSFFDEGNDHPSQIEIGKRAGRGMGSHPTVSKWLWRAEAYGLVEIEPIPGGRGRLAGYRYRRTTKRLLVVEDSSSNAIEDLSLRTTTTGTTRSPLVVNASEDNELIALGVTPGNARQILETMGKEYVHELALYADKHGTRSKAGLARHLFKGGWKPKAKVAEPCWRCFVPVEPGLTQCPNCGEGVKEVRNG